MAQANCREKKNVQLTPDMAKAFECSALTTAEFHSSRKCRVCDTYDHPSKHFLPHRKYKRPFTETPPSRAGKTTSPETDYYWLMDKQTYNVAIECHARQVKLIRDYERRMHKRDNFIESEQYVDIARGFGTSIWEDLFCCCLKPKKNGK